MKIAAIIPARKGSKRIPNKNQYKIEGELGIQKVLNNLGNTKYVNDVFLSTDDEYLIENTKNRIFLDREENFNDDFSSVIELVKYHQETQLFEYDMILLAYSHSINISHKIYEKAITSFKNDKSNRLITIAQIPTPIEWLSKINNKNKIKPIYPNGELIRSQDATKGFYNMGQFYIFKKEWFKKLNLQDSYYFELESLQGVDVDYPEDLERLETIYKINKSIYPELF